jgi:hypothetical protein
MGAQSRWTSIEKVPAVVFTSTRKTSGAVMLTEAGSRSEPFSAAIAETTTNTIAITRIKRCITSSTEQKHEMRDGILWPL